MAKPIVIPALPHPDADDPLDERLEAAHQLRRGGFVAGSGSPDEVEEVGRWGHGSLDSVKSLVLLVRFGHFSAVVNTWAFFDKSKTEATIDCMDGREAEPSLAHAQTRSRTGIRSQSLTGFTPTDRQQRQILPGMAFYHHRGPAPCPGSVLFGLDAGSMFSSRLNRRRSRDGDPGAPPAPGGRYLDQSQQAAPGTWPATGATESPGQSDDVVINVSGPARP